MATVVRSMTKPLVYVFGRRTGAVGNVAMDGCTIRLYLIFYMIPTGGTSCTRYFGHNFRKTVSELHSLLVARLYVYVCPK
jgi:hypothetical protein